MVRNNVGSSVVVTVSSSSESRTAVCNKQNNTDDTKHFHFTPRYHFRQIVCKEPTRNLPAAGS